MTNKNEEIPRPSHPNIKKKKLELKIITNIEKTKINFNETNRKKFNSCSI